jgi:hypothetical protein
MERWRLPTVLDWAGPLTAASRAPAAGKKAAAAGGAVLWAVGERNERF